MAAPTAGVAPAGQPITPTAAPNPIGVTPNGQTPIAGQNAPMAGQTPQEVAQWKAAMNEDLRGYIDAKGFRGPEILAEAYRNFEKLQGVPQDKIIKLQGEMYDKDGKLTADGRSIYERMGTPKEAKDYQLEIPPGGDPKVSEHFAQVFHEAGVPKAMAEKIVKSFNEFSNQNLQAQQLQQKQAFESQNQSLKQEWGMAFDSNLNIAKEAVRTMGITDQQINALSSTLGHAETLKFFNKLGKSVSESPFIGGRPAGGAMEPAMAREQIRTLTKDTAFGAKLQAGDSEAKSKWDNLHRYAYPG